MDSLGCHSYSVPEFVRSHIDLIKPTVHFLHRVPTPDQLQKRAFERPSTHIRTGPKTDGSKVTITPSLENCDETITLDCLRALYSIDHTPVSTDKNTFGICEVTPISGLVIEKLIRLYSGIHSSSIPAERS